MERLTPVPSIYIEQFLLRMFIFVSKCVKTSGLILQCSWMFPLTFKILEAFLKRVNSEPKLRLDPRKYTTLVWRASNSLTWLAKALFVQFFFLCRWFRMLFLHALCQNNELIFVQMHPSLVAQFPFGAASGNFTMVPVSSVKAFLKVFFCSDFLVHCSTVIILLEPRLCQEGLSAVLCPPCLSPCMHPCWDVRGRSAVNSRWVLMASPFHSLLWVIWSPADRISCCTVGPYTGRISWPLLPLKIPLLWVFGKLQPTKPAFVISLKLSWNVWLKGLCHTRLLNIFLHDTLPLKVKHNDSYLQ